MRRNRRERGREREAMKGKNNDNLKLTSSNSFVSFEMQKRPYNTALPLQGNFYPITCTAILRNRTNSVQLTFLTDRTHSGIHLFRLLSRGKSLFYIMELFYFLTDRSCCWFQFFFRSEYYVSFYI